MTVTQITDDIVQVRVPLPFALNHVNCYLIRDRGDDGRDGWALIDTALTTPDAQATWRAAFAELDMRPRDLTRIVVTHTHPDHFGLAGWFQALAADDGARPIVYLSETDAGRFDVVWRHMNKLDFGHYLRLGGVTPDIIENVADSFMATLAMTYPHPADFGIVHPGEALRIGARTFTPIHAPGHSEGQMMLYDADDGLIFSGDHVLMKITPNIGLWAESSPDPLGQFIESLDGLRDLPVRAALPGHRQIITDWRGRIDELRAHHEARLNRCLAAVDGGAQTGYAVAGQIFDPSRFTVHEWRFAVAETLAHLEYLRLRGRLMRADGDGGPDTVWTYHRAQAGTERRDDDD
jgi:glyoxylase-like metal-dependent hydrolase (beta-lactamase superfamily II)